MKLSRRQFIATTAGTITFLPFTLRAAGHSGDTFDTAAGQITVHPISHASFVMETPMGTLYVDPVGEPASYANSPAPDLILITHEHGDHYNADTLAAIAGDTAPLITNPAVHAMLPADLQARATQMANGESASTIEITIDAIPAYKNMPPK